MYSTTREHQGHMTKSNTPTCKRVRKLSETEPAKISSQKRLPPNLKASTKSKTSSTIQKLPPKSRLPPKSKHPEMKKVHWQSLLQLGQMKELAREKIWVWWKWKRVLRKNEDRRNDDGGSCCTEIHRGSSSCWWSFITKIPNPSIPSPQILKCTHPPENLQKNHA